MSELKATLLVDRLVREAGRRWGMKGTLVTSRCPSGVYAPLPASISNSRRVHVVLGALWCVLQRAAGRLT